MKSPLSIAVLAGVALACSAAQADTGKLLLTGGVSTIAGSAGGGLTPWAVIGSNATEGEVGVSAYATRAATQDYSLNGYGVALGLHDRGQLIEGQRADFVAWDLQHPNELAYWFGRNPCLQVIAQGAPRP